MKLLIPSGNEPYLAPQLKLVISRLESEDDFEQICELLNEFDAEDAQVCDNSIYNYIIYIVI